MSIFWIIFIFSWTWYAAFVGLGAFLFSRPHDFRSAPYIVAAALIVLCTALLLISQNAFGGHIISSPIFLLSLAFLILLVIAWFLSGGLPKEIARPARALTAGAFVVAVMWCIGSPAKFFLPVLFVRDDDFLLTHLLFACAFGFVSFLTFYLLKRIPVRDEPSDKSDQKDFPNLGYEIGNWRFALRVVLALFLLFWLSQWILPRPNGGLGSRWGNPGMSPAILGDSEIVCTGHFSRLWQPFRWCWDVQLKPGRADGYPVPISARRKIVPFVIDHYWKGSGPNQIEVALFEPSEKFWGNAWLLPAQENLLVALKKDTTGSGAYQLVNQVNSWLVVDAAVPDNSNAVSPEQAIEIYAADYLARYAAAPGAQKTVKLVAPLTIDSISSWGGIFEQNNVSVIQQAFETIKNFKIRDSKTVALLEKILALPRPHAERKGGNGVTFIGNGTTFILWTPDAAVRREALATLAGIDPVKGWQQAMVLYRKKTADAPERVYLSEVLPQAITADSLSQIDPREIHEMFDGDLKLARQISYTFGKIKGPIAISWQAQFLSNPDWEIQYNGMAGLNQNLGGWKAGFPLFAEKTFRQHREACLAPYKAWWEQHRAEYPPL